MSFFLVIVALCILVIHARLCMQKFNACQVSWLIIPTPPFPTRAHTCAHTHACAHVYVHACTL